MRRILVLCVLVLAGFWPRISLAGCPGISACVYNQGCPKGSTLVGPLGVDKTVDDVLLEPGINVIQRAIDAAPSAGATLCVAPGTYVGPIDFHGKPIQLLSSGGPAVTILDGGGSGRVVTFASAEGRDSLLDGFTVRNGRSAYGGGIYIERASPTIRNSIVTANAASGTYGRGGGVGVLGAQASPSITCTQFLANTADYSGGGLIVGYSAAPYLRSNVFAENQAPFGGAIGVYASGRLDLGWSELVANQAGGDGGGIHAGIAYGSLLLRQVWFKGNTAGGYGGGIWVPAGLADAVNCTFDGNRAAVGGAIAAGYGGMVDVASTLFVRNTSNTASAVLVNTDGTNTSVVNHYNGFFGNSGGNFSATYGNSGLLTPGTDPLGSSCCPAPGSPAIDAGIPNYHFNDANGSRSDMGACGGPALSVYGPLE